MFIIVIIITVVGRPPLDSFPKDLQLPRLGTACIHHESAVLNTRHMVGGRPIPHLPNRDLYFKFFGPNGQPFSVLEQL